jgi:hypothetical protein
MSSSKLILFFIGIILLVVVILSSNKIGSFLRQKFGKIVPTSILPYSQPSPTPTKIPVIPTSIIYNNSQTFQTQSQNNNNYYTKKSTSSNQIPATGPEELVWLIIGGSFATGITLNKFISKKYK